MNNISPVNQTNFTATYAAMGVVDPTPKTSRIQRVVKRVFNFLFRVFLFPGASILKYAILDSKRLERTKTQLESIGGKRLTLETPDGDRIDGMYLRAADFQNMLNTYFDRNVDEKGKMTLTLKPEYTKDRALIERLNHLGLIVLEVDGKYKLDDSGIVPLGPPSVNLPPLASIENKTSEPTVLIAQGAAGSYPCYKKLILSYLSRGINVMTVDYRGYNKSEGTPSDEKIKLDLETAYQYLVQERHVANKDLLVHGHCIGGGPASDLAARHTDVNILLDRTFPTYGDVAEENFSSIKSIIRKILPSIANYNVAENLEHVTGHIAVVRAENDDMISEALTMKLIDHLPNTQKGQFVKLIHHEGVHDDTLIYRPLTAAQFDYFLERTHLRRAF